MKFWLYIMYKLMHMLQFVNQFFACTRSFLTHTDCFLWCLTEPVTGFQILLECADCLWPEAAASRCPYFVMQLLLFQVLIILHQWNLKELLCTKFVMRVVYFVHNFNEVTAVYANVAG